MLGLEYMNCDMGGSWRINKVMLAIHLTPWVLPWQLTSLWLDFNVFNMLQKGLFSLLETGALEASG